MDLFHSFLIQWGKILWTISWQITILFVLIGLISLISRKASPNFRYWLWCIILLRLCLPIELKLPIGMGERIWQTVITVPYLINEEVANENISTPAQSVPISPSSSSEITSAVLSSPDQVNIPDESIVSNPDLSFEEITTVIWALAVLIIMMFLIMRAVYIYNSLKESEVIENPELVRLLKRLCIELGIRQSVELHYLDFKRINGPLAVGIFRPKVYLPRCMAEKWEAKDIEPLLVHELAHIKRFDIIINWIQNIVQVFYFFHPLVWYSNLKIRKIREDICDDMAIGHSQGDRTIYTERMLLAVKDYVREGALSFIAVGFTETKSSLAKRITRILSNKYKNHSKMTVFSAVFLIIVALLSISLVSGNNEEVHETDIKNVNIVDTGDDVNSKGITSLIGAAAGDHIEIVQALIDAGADVNAKDHSGWTALDHAAVKGHTEIVKILLKAGADVNAKDSNGGTEQDTENKLTMLKTPFSDTSGELSEIIKIINRLPWTGAGKDAIEAFKKAKSIKLDIYDSWFKLGLTLFDGGYYKESFEAFNIVTELIPLKSELDSLYYFAALVWFGHLEDLQGNREKALSYYNKSLKYWDKGDLMQHSQYDMFINRKWVEERLRSPFFR